METERRINTLENTSRATCEMVSQLNEEILILQDENKKLTQLTTMLIHELSGDRTDIPNTLSAWRKLYK